MHCACYWCKAFNVSVSKIMPFIEAVLDCLNLNVDFPMEQSVKIGNVAIKYVPELASAVTTLKKNLYRSVQAIKPTQAFPLEKAYNMLQYSHDMHFIFYEIHLHWFYEIHLHWISYREQQMFTLNTFDVRVHISHQCGVHSVHVKVSTTSYQKPLMAPSQVRSSRYRTRWIF